MKFVAQVVPGCLLMGAFALAAQSPVSVTPRAEITFQLERPDMPVSNFTMRLHEDGTGSYQAEEVEGSADGTSVRYASDKHILRTMDLTPATVTRIFNAARDLNRFRMDCDSKKKNIANTGKKTLSYTDADGVGSCIYNYSDNKKITMLTDTFIALAYTMDEGRRLEYLHRYDRLGLDAETISLEQAVKDGRALELVTIAPVLTSIAGDMAVMERVRLRSARLLEQSKGR